jgi:hypothetical protein
MKRGIALALATSLAVALPAGVAMAGNRDMIQEGSCTGSSDWKLELSPENGQIEVEFEVDQNVSGDRWRVKILHDGDRVFRGTRTTGGASGSFDVRIVEDDGPARTRSAPARATCRPTRCAGAARPSSRAVIPNVPRSLPRTVGRLLYH